MAKITEPTNALGFLPDDMSQGGLASDFEGTIVEARFVEWNYDGKLDKNILASRLTIQPDNESVNDGKPVVQHYSVGDLKNHAPSTDGVEPADDGEEGYFYVPVGKNTKGLPDSSNFSHFIFGLKDAFEASGRDMKKEVTRDIRSLEGLAGYFKRVPQKQRAGMQSTSATGEDGQKRVREILLLTTLSEAKKTAGKSAQKGAATASGKTNGAVASTGTGNDDLRGKVEELIVGALAEAPDNSLPKKNITPTVINSFTGPEKSAAIKLLGDASFLNGSESFSYDKDSGVLSLS